MLGGALLQQFASVLPVLPLWSVTNLSIHNSIPLGPAVFDLVIIDEAGQSDIASALPLLYRAKRALIIGDALQLRHIASIAPSIDHALRDRHGLVGEADQTFGYVRNSVFDLALSARSAKIYTLMRNYRSHSDIIAFSNSHWYQGRLVIDTAYSTLRAPPAWRPLSWHDVRAQAIADPTGGVCVPAEVEAVYRTITELQETEFVGSVGIVAPFRAQVAAIRHALSRLDRGWRDGHDLKIATAHGFQGDERDVMIVCLSVTSDLPTGARRFLEQTGYLLNVALTRARAACYIVGDRTACASSGIAHYASLAQQMKPMQAQPAHEPRSRQTVGPDEALLVDALRQPA